MCGRGALTLSGDKCRRVAGGARQGGITKVRNAEKLKTKYNLGPMNYVPVVRSVQGSSPYADSDREVCAMRWGLVPSFAKNEEEYNAFKGGNSTFNARIEGAEARNLWKRLLDKRRCIVLFDGFYEWKAHADGKTKIPMFIRNKDEYDGHIIPWSTKEEAMEDEKPDGHAPLLLAGLYDTWQDDGKELLESVTILTMDPQHTAMEQVHDRMPVFLTPESARTWLDLRQPFAEIVPTVLKAAQAHAQTQLHLYEVSSLVSNIKNESPDCILPKKEYSAKQLTKGIGRFFKSKTDSAKQQEAKETKEANTEPLPKVVNLD